MLKKNIGSDWIHKYMSWPLMEEEDVGGPKRSHDPHQPAHVTRPRTQLPQIKPGEAWRWVNRHCHTTHTRKSTHTYAGTQNSPICLPRGVGGSNKEIDHHPVTHVETVLHRPEERPNSLVKNWATLFIHVAAVCFGWRQGMGSVRI